jgi:hypothetical protein
LTSLAELSRANVFQNAGKRRAAHGGCAKKIFSPGVAAEWITCQSARPREPLSRALVNHTQAGRFTRALQKSFSRFLLGRRL